MAEPAKPDHGTFPEKTQYKSTGLFRHASIGGTFNTLHDYHRDYIVAALTLAHTVHLFLATDNYAQQRKIYNPLPMADRLRSLEALLNDIRCADRVEIEGLEQVSDMQTYAEGRKEL